jgi:O-antigen/teichoic acid export membrane protein
VSAFQKTFLGSLLLLVVLNALVKPLWIFGIDRNVQNLTGFAAYGRYFAMLGFCLVFGFLLDPGLNIHLNRQAAARPSDRVALFWNTLYTKAALVAVYALAVMAFAWLSGIRDAGFVMPYIALVTLISLLGFLRTFLSAAQCYRQDAVLSILDKAVVIAAVGGMILYPAVAGPVTIERFVAVQTLAIALSVALAGFFIVRHVEGFAFQPFRGFRRDLLLASLPFALNNFLMTVILRSDAFLLERLHPDGAHEAGVYAAGFRILDAFSMMGTLVGGFLLSFIARHWPERTAIEPTLAIARRALICVAILIGVTGCVLPEYLTALLYHRSDAPLVAVMRTILLALPGLSLVSIYGTLLTATGHIGAFIRISLSYAVILVILNLLLIPAYGALACSIVTVAVETAYALSLVRAARRLTGIGLHPGEGLSYLFVALMGFGAIRILVYLGVSTPLAVVLTGACTVGLFYAILGIRMRLPEGGGKKR